MPDSDAVRAKRARAHRNDDHSMCGPRCPAKKLATPPARGTAPPPDPEPPPETPIRDAILAVLTEEHVATTPLGQIALDTALVLDRSRAIVGRAPLVRELRDTLTAALSAKPAADDPVTGILLSIGDRLH